MNKLRKTLIFLNGLALLIVLLGLFFNSPLGKNIKEYSVTLVNSLELSLLDKRLSLRARQLTPSNEIVVVSMDKKMMSDARLYPEMGISGLSLPRNKLADVIDYISEQKPKAIILDIELLSDEDEDPELLQSLNKAGNVYSAFRMDNSLVSFIQNKKIAPEHLDVILESSGMNSEEEFQTDFCLGGFYRQNHQQTPAFLNKLKQSSLPYLNSGKMPVSLLNQITFCNSGYTAAKLLPGLKGLGVSSVRYDSDAFVRKVLPIFRGYEGRIYGNLSLKPAIDGLDIDQIEYQEGTLALYKKGRVYKKIKLDKDGKVIINWRDPENSIELIKGMGASKQQIEELEQNFVTGEANTFLGGGVLYRHISVADILRVKYGIDLEKRKPFTLFNLPYPDAEKTGMFSFQDKYVVIGNTVTDIHQTPLAKVTPGPEIIATGLDMYLHDSTFVHRLPVYWVMGITVVLAIVMSVLILRLDSIVAPVLYSISMGVVLIQINFELFSHHAIWMPLISPLLVLAFTVVLSVFYRHQVHDREKRYLTNVFSKYISPQVMEQVIDDPETALEKLKGDKRYMTVLFADLYGFTSYMEKADPEVIMNQLTTYFDAMMEVVYKYGGTYDKFMGDGILVFFGAPVELPDHAYRACQAALEMQEVLKTINEQFEDDGLEELNQGIGISTGDMIVGNFGSTEIKNFTVMGSAVNLGSRLEGYTRRVDGNILISSETYNNVESAVTSTCYTDVGIRGLEEKITVYSLEGLTEKA